MKKQCLEPLTKSMPYLMARIYLEQHLSISARNNARKIVNAVKDSFVQSMSEKNWMEDSKDGLVGRVKSINMNIGYPDWILNDQNLENFYSILVSI